jgi:hypothetical protein
MYPQEVLVKVQVTQRSNADAGAKLFSSWRQQQQQQGHAHAKAQHSQQQQEACDKARAAQQHAQVEDPVLHSTQLQGYASQDVGQRSGSTCPGSSRSSTSSSSADSSSTWHPPAKQRMVPMLDLSKAQLGKGPAPAKGPEQQALTRSQAERDDELCLDHSTRRAIMLHPEAPMQDNRCYHYKAMGGKVRSQTKQ